MKKIYYLTGRGGSLAIANKLAEKMGADIPIPMTGRHYPNRIVPDPAELVGLVFPVFNFGVPDLYYNTSKHFHKSAEPRISSQLY